MNILNYFGILTFSLFASCAPSYYSPNMQNVPCLDQKNAFRANAAIGLDGVDVQTAYAPINHLGLQLNYASYIQKPSHFTELGKGGGIELGLGYIKKFDKFLFESYALCAKGNFENQANVLNPLDLKDDGKLLSDFTRLSLQPSIAFIHNNFEIIVSTRLSQLHYYNTEGNYSEASTNLGNYLRNEPNHYLVEPALTLRLGLKNVKFQLQWVKAFNLKDEYYYRFVPNNMFAGLILQL